LSAHNKNTPFCDHFVDHLGSKMTVNVEHRTLAAFRQYVAEYSFTVGLLHKV